MMLPRETMRPTVSTVLGLGLILAIVFNAGAASQYGDTTPGGHPREEPDLPDNVYDDADFSWPCHMHEIFYGRLYGPNETHKSVQEAQQSHTDCKVRTGFKLWLIDQLPGADLQFIQGGAITRFTAPSPSSSWRYDIMTAPAVSLDHSMGPASAQAQVNATLKDNVVTIKLSARASTTNGKVHASADGGLHHLMLCYRAVDAKRIAFKFECGGQGKIVGPQSHIDIFASLQRSRTLCGYSGYISDHDGLPPKWVTASGTTTVATDRTGLACLKEREALEIFAIAQSGDVGEGGAAEGEATIKITATAE
jgi:hypothetical protein